MCPNNKQMMNYLSITDDILETAFEEKVISSMGFTTSADVVMKAGGLRLEAIRVIAREQGVEIEDTACRCIDESLLAALADAHVRKMRAYFNNAHRHLADLVGDELAAYVDFCKTFKRRQSSENAALSWIDIDTDAIREQFLQKVHELTPSVFDLFAGTGNLVIENRIVSLSFESCGNFLFWETYEYKLRSDVVDRILHSYLFYEKPVTVRIACIDIRSVVRRVTLSARYHLYTSEDDDHLQDVRDNLVIYHAPAMVA